MTAVALAAEDDFDAWRENARRLALEGVTPDDVVWRTWGGVDDLFADGSTDPRTNKPLPSLGRPAFSVPRAFLDLAQTVILHADSARFAVLYSLLLRVRANPRLLEDQADPLVRRADRMAMAVRRDIHKMRAFVRFREAGEGEAQRFVAWFEPDHHIVRANAGFFVRRFATMRWSILTPALSIHWDGKKLMEGPGASKADAPKGDPIEDVWRTYYASIFNPARIKIGAMLKEMPRKYWKNIPETALIPNLVAGAQAREQTMVTASRERPKSNCNTAWEALREEAASCTRCPLFRSATRTVFGEGPVDAALMLVGEQPGDQEDLTGKPFVGPAGQMLDRALAEAGVDRAGVYVTNAVKHFKFEPRGKRRIHSKPNAGEIEACRWWIDQERAIIRPKVTLALGATAARSLLGKAVTISGSRGRIHGLADGGEGWVTIHPSYLLRIDDADKSAAEYRQFVADLRNAGERAGAIT